MTQPPPSRAAASASAGAAVVLWLDDWLRTCAMRRDWWKRKGPSHVAEVIYALGGHEWMAGRDGPVDTHGRLVHIGGPGGWTSDRRASP